MAIYLCCSNSCLSFSSNSFNFFSKTSFCPSCFAFLVIALNRNEDYIICVLYMYLCVLVLGIGEDFIVDHWFCKTN